MRSPIRVALLAGLLATAVPLGARAGEADRLALTYEVTVSGFHVIDFELRVALDDRSYDITTDFRTRGFLNWLLSWQSVSRSAGKVVDGAIRPQNYEQLGTFRGRERVVRIDYRDGRVADIELVPPPVDDGDREIIPADAMAGALDPAAMLYSVIQQVSTGASCTRVVPIFDGRRRFDLEFVDRGTDVLETSDPRGFAGEARVCEFTYRMVAGFVRNETSGADRQREPRTGRVWLARVLPGQPLAPVRIEVDNTNWGATIAELRALPTVAPCTTVAAAAPAPAPATC